MEPASALGELRNNPVITPPILGSNRGIVTKVVSSLAIALMLAVSSVFIGATSVSAHSGPQADVMPNLPLCTSGLTYTTIENVSKTSGVYTIHAHLQTVYYGSTFCGYRAEGELIQPNDTVGGLLQSSLAAGGTWGSKQVGDNTSGGTEVFYAESSVAGSGASCTTATAYFTPTGGQQFSVTTPVGCR